MSMPSLVNIPISASSVSGPQPFDFGENYAFYDARNGLIPDYYQKLLSTATSSIQIWDTHTKSTDWQVFSQLRNTGIKITLITICDNHFYEEKDVRRLANDIKNNMDSAVTHFTLSIYAFHNWCRFSEKLWHDRFLIIDDTHYFLIGPSLNNQYGSSTSFGIFRLSHINDINLLKRELDSYRVMTGNPKLRHKASSSQ